MANIKLSVAIFSHPSRAERLQQTLGLLGDDVKIKVIIDEKTEGIWRTAMRAWRSYDSDATHHLVLQDDIIPCRNFLTSVPYIISDLPQDASVSFCDNIQSIKYAIKTGRSWVVSTQVRHAQALIQPVGQIEDWIQWSEWNVRPSYYHDDGRLEIYLVKHNRRIWHTVPSLVSHDDNGSVYRYLTKNETKPEGKAPYVEYKFIGVDTDPLSINWDVQDNYVGNLTRPSRLKMPERWAVGEIEFDDRNSQQAMMYTNSRIWNEDVFTRTYEEDMAIARKERGLI